MASGATAYLVPGLGLIEVNARDGRVEVKRSVQGVEIARVVVTFEPGSNEPRIEELHRKG